MEGVELEDKIEKSEGNKWILEESSKLSQSYAQYMMVDLSKEKAQINESTDDLLTKLEEFLAVVELAKNDSMDCLERALPAIVAKYKELEKVFSRIDELGEFVNVVKEKVDEAGALVAEKEKQLLPESSFSKLLSPIFSRRSNAKDSVEPSDEFVPVKFRVKDYIQPAPSIKKEEGDTS